MTSMEWCGLPSSSTQYTYGTPSERVKAIGNEIFFTSTISTDTINRLIDELVKLADKSVVGTLSSGRQQTSPTRVTLYIDSPGGSVKDVLKYVDFVHILRRRGRLHLTTVIVGLAASAATIMACIGDARYVTMHSTCMIHELFGGSIGTYTQLTSGMKYLKHMHDTIVSIYMSTTKKCSKEKITDMLLRETWFTPQEYMDKGFVDGFFETV